VPFVGGLSRVVISVPIRVPTARHALWRNAGSALHGSPGEPVPWGMNGCDGLKPPGDGSCVGLNGLIVPPGFSGPAKMERPLPGPEYGLNDFAARARCPVVYATIRSNCAIG
jgi:hypothetical protein